MQVIALTGLVSVEKIQLTLWLAKRLHAAGQRVALLDNLARLRLDPVPGVPARLIRHAGALSGLAGMLLPLVPDTDVVLVAVAEDADPEQLFATLSELPAPLHTLAVAILDLRTCDCFPGLRLLLEAHADLVINLTEPHPTITQHPALASLLAAVLPHPP